MKRGPQSLTKFMVNRKLEIQHGKLNSSLRAPGCREESQACNSSIYLTNVNWVPTMARHNAKRQILRETQNVVPALESWQAVNGQPKKGKYRRKRLSPWSQHNVPLWDAPMISLWYRASVPSLCAKSLEHPWENLNKHWGNENQLDASKSRHISSQFLQRATLPNQN